MPFDLALFLEILSETKITHLKLSPIDDNDTVRLAETITLTNVISLELKGFEHFLTDIGKLALQSIDQQRDCVKVYIEILPHPHAHVVVVVVVDCRCFIPQEKFQNQIK